jgi:hypothetical protein
MWMIHVFYPNITTQLILVSLTDTQTVLVDHGCFDSWLRCFWCLFHMSLIIAEISVIQLLLSISAHIILFVAYPYTFLEPSQTCRSHMKFAQCSICPPCMREATRERCVASTVRSRLLQMVGFSNVLTNLAVAISGLMTLGGVSAGIENC